MLEGKRLAFFLPNTFTALNMACGFASCIFSLKGNFYAASMVIILGAVFDSVDGRLARLTGTQSSFGEQFDSMSDLVSFGMAPTFLMYHKYLIGYDRLGLVVAFVFLLCGALRLARFNANIDKVSSDFFQGLPIPGAALGVIGLVLLTDKFPFLDDFSFLAVPYTAIYGLLMISTIPFCSFKNIEWVRKRKRMSLFIFFMTLAAVYIYYQIMIASVMTLYVISSILYYVVNKKKFGDAFHWKDGEDENA
jgi:CDP-diacylglycerol---serine O-phosphatidyltransferase